MADNTKRSYRDLQDYLFIELDRLTDDEFFKDKKKAEIEIKRAGAICDIVEEMVSTSKVQLEAVRLYGEYNLKKADIPVNLLTE